MKKIKHPNCLQIVLCQFKKKMFEDIYSNRKRSLYGDGCRRNFSWRKKYLHMRIMPYTKIQFSYINIPPFFDDGQTERRRQQKIPVLHIKLMLHIRVSFTYSKHRTIRRKLLYYAWHSNSYYNFTFFSLNIEFVRNYALEPLRLYAITFRCW